MPNRKIPDGALVASILPTTEFEVSVGGAVQLKGNGSQIKDFVNAGLTGGKKIEGGTTASEELVLESTAHATKGKVRVETASDFETEIVDFNLAPTQTAQEGRSQWNPEAGTVSIGMPGGTGTLEVGQEFMISNRPKNVQGVQINDGQVVVISGATGSILEMVLVNASDFPSACRTIAVATENIPNNQRGRYTTNGMVRDIKTDYPTWSEGQEIWLDTVDGGMTNVMPAAPNVAVRIGYITRAHATEGEIFVSIDVDRTAITREVTQEPTGFTAPENVIVTYDSVTRKVTLTGTVNAYYQGTPIAALVSGWVSDAHSASFGEYFLVYDGTAFSWIALSALTFSHLHIAYVTYESADKICVRETHGVMQWQSHKENHETIGTYKLSGGTLADYVLSSTTVADRRPSVSTTVVKDEDLPTTNASVAADGPYTQFTLSSTDTVNYDTTALDIIPLSGNQPYFNEFTGGVWQQTLMTNSNYTSIWLVAVPCAADTDSQKYRYLWIQGQDESLSLAAQTGLSVADVTLGTFGNITPEFIFISQVIIRFIGANWQIEEVRLLEGTRLTQTSSPQGTGLSVVETDATLSGNGTVADPLSVVEPIEKKFLFTASAGQAIFPGLPTTPENPSFVKAIRNGNDLLYGTDFTISGSTLTWLGVTLVAGEVINGYYADAGLVARIGVSVKTASYTLTNNDGGTYVVGDSASALPITVPETSTESIPAGTFWDIYNGNSGDVTIAKEGSDVLNGNTLVAPGAWARIVKRIEGSPNTYDISGGTSIQIFTIEHIITGSIANSGGTPYRYSMPEYDGTIISITGELRSGTADLDLEISSVAVTHTTLSLSSTETTQAATANNVFVDGDNIDFVITNASSADRLVLTLKCTGRL